MEEWLARIEENTDEAAEVLLVGNKVDLVNERVVRHEDSAALAERHGVAYCETSAKDYAAVEQAFKRLLKNVLANDRLQEAIAVKPQAAQLARPRPRGQQQ